MMKIYTNNSEFLYRRSSNNRMIKYISNKSTIGVNNQHKTSFLLETLSFKDLLSENRIIHSIKTNQRKKIVYPLIALIERKLKFWYKLNSNIIKKENRFHIILVMIALFREIFSQYFSIIASIVATKISQTTIYKFQSQIINGNTNHSNGSVIVVGITHRKRSFLLEISSFSYNISCTNSSFFRNVFAIKNKTSVSIIVAKNRSKGNFLIFSRFFILLDTIS